MIGRIISHFKILQRIGAGGMGVVFKAEDLRVPGRIVAIKILHSELIADDDLKKRFLNEARAASSLDHPNICQIGEVDETDEGRPFMTMAYYGGPSLRHLLADAPLEPLQSMQIAYSIAQGLAGAHRHGIIHRDIKPGNVMINEDGFVKIVDFGLARLAGATRVTHTNTTLGTVAYMSPQQAGRQEVDGRTDIWSLGVVFYEMLTGKVPFHGQIDQAMLYSILNEDHRPACEENPRVSRDISEIVDRCLQKDVQQRYATVDKLVEDLLRVSRGMGWESSLTGAMVGPVSFRPRRPETRRFRVGALIALAVASAVWATYMLWPRSDPSLYTTATRLAVLPIESRIGPECNAFGAGLAVIISDILESFAEPRRSLWVVPGLFVAFGDPVDAPAARDAFGINFVLTGDIQRYSDRKRLTLRLLNGSGEELRSDIVDFSGETPEAVAMITAVFELVGIEDADPGACRAFFPADDISFRAYVAAVGLQWADPDSAAVLLEGLRERSPAFGPGRTTLGQVYFDLYKRTYTDSLWNQAQDELRRGRSLTPRDPRAHFQLGYFFRLSQEPDSAVTCMQKALELAPDFHLAERGLARTYRAQDRIDEARQVLAAAVNKRRDCFSDYRSMGIFCYRIHEYDEAAHWLNRAVELAPADVYSINALGAAYHVTGQWSRAREMFRRSLQLSPNCDNCNNVGLMYYYETRFFDSAKYYETALSYCDSTDHEAWGNWAAALYWVDGERERALSIYEKAIDLATRDLAYEPDDADIISSLIDYCSMSGKDEETRRLIELGLPFAPNDPDMAFRIGIAYEQLENRNSALEYIGEAIRHDYPVEIIERTPVLRDLRMDVRYQQMVVENRGEAQE